MSASPRLASASLIRRLSRIACIGKLVGLGLALLTAGMVQADTSVGGSIAASTTWSVAQGPYIVTSNIDLQNGATLNIEPGTKIFMGAGTRLTVQAGSVRALGTLLNPILVSSQKVQAGQPPAPGDWDQWVFGSGTVNSQLDYVRFEYGKGLVVNGSAPLFNYLEIKDHQGAAITIDLAASPAGLGNQASGSTLNAVLVPSGDINTGVTWGLRGIPYLLASGTVSVGKPPQITGISPAQVQQGRSIDATITGSRLDGMQKVLADSPLLAISIKSSATSDAAIVTISADPKAPLGAIGLVASTTAGDVRAENALSIVPYLPDQVVSGITPSSLRRGESIVFTLTGNNLAGASVVGRMPQLTTSVLSSALTSLQVRVTAAADTPLGEQKLAVSNPGKTTGVAEVSLTVGKALPTLVVNPSPIAVFLGASGGDIRVGLSDVAEQTYVLDLLLTDPTIATLSSAQVTIPPGGKDALVTLLGKSYGQSELKVSTAGMTSLSVPVQVKADFSKLKTSFFSPAVSVIVDGPLGNTGLSFAAPSVGVIVDSALGQADLSRSAPAIGVVLDENVIASPYPAYAAPLGVDLATQ